MSLKGRKSDKLRDLEINKITYMVDCLKAKIKDNEPITEEDKMEILTEIEQSVNTIIGYNDSLSAEPIEHLE